MGKPLGGSAKYLENVKTELAQHCVVSSAAQWLDPVVQLAAFRHRATRLCVHAVEQLRQESGGNPVFEGAPWDSCNTIVIR